MPTYCYVCDMSIGGADTGCGAVVERVKFIADRDSLEECPECSLPMSRDQVTEYRGSYTRKQILEYFDEGLGIVVKDCNHWLKHLDKKGFTPYTKNESLLDGKR